MNRYFGFSIPCVFHEITGFYCPGCGVTRMLFSLLKLDFYQAFRYNPLLFILLILFLMCKIIELVKKRKIVFSEKVYYVIIVILLIYGVVRNIPIFGFLEPTAI